MIHQARLTELTKEKATVSVSLKQKTASHTRTERGGEAAGQARATSIKPRTTTTASWATWEARADALDHVEASERDREEGEAHRWLPAGRTSSAAGGVVGR